MSTPGSRVADDAKWKGVLEAGNAVGLASPGLGVGKEEGVVEAGNAVGLEKNDKGVVETRNA